MKNNSMYFRNTDCEYYPCHETDGGYFNCMFCYCPLYCLGDKCGGNYEYTDKGIKDCTKCLVPHSRNGFSYVSDKLRAVCEMTKKSRNQQES